MVLAFQQPLKCCCSQSQMSSSLADFCIHLGAKKTYIMMIVVCAYVFFPVAYLPLHSMRRERVSHQYEEGLNDSHSDP